MNTRQLLAEILLQSDQQTKLLREIRDAIRAAPEKQAASVEALEGFMRPLSELASRAMLQETTPTIRSEPVATVVEKRSDGMRVTQAP